MMRLFLEKVYVVIIEVNNGDDVVSLFVFVVIYVNLVVLYCIVLKCIIFWWRDVFVFVWRVFRERFWISKKKFVLSVLLKDN